MSEKSNEMMLGLVKELQTQLNPTSSSSRKVLITRILSSIENESTSELPGHVSGSPISDCESDLSRDGSRKRCWRKLAGWSQKVRVCEQTGLEGPLDDGYSWRKYGQEDILGAKYPRGYYKCTFLKTLGCPALKQVQRSGLDPSIFNVTYIGRHICVEGLEIVSPGQCSPIKQKPNQHTNDHEQREKKSPQETLISFQKSSYHQVKKEEKDSGDRMEHDSFPSFSLPSLKVENCFFETTSTPTTSESSNNFEGKSGEQNIFHNSADSHDSKNDEMIISSSPSNATSTEDDYPMSLDSCWDWDYPVDYI